jgi:hypothetical protein
MAKSTARRLGQLAGLLYRGLADFGLAWTGLPPSVPPTAGGAPVPGEERFWEELEAELAPKEGNQAGRRELR